jgi:branched-chain amino acid aminotransferase
VRDGEVATPPMGVSILAGITRNSVMRVMEGLGLTVHERLISRDELYIADEVFMVGTAAEVTPVRELDDRKIGEGSRGPITEKVQTAYFDAVRGVKIPDESWLAIV